MENEIIKELWRASESKNVCRINLKKELLPRVVHPYGVCRTSANKIVLVCWQEAGFTKAGGKAGYRNLILDRIIEIEPLQKHFSVDDEFNPDDGQYKEWVYHI